MCLSNTTDFHLFRAKYALIWLSFYGWISCCKIIDWYIKTRKSHTDVTVTAIDALILIFGLSRIKAFINNFKDFINDLDAFLEVFFCKNNLFNMIIASCETDEPFFHIDIIVLFDHHCMKNKLEFVRLEYRILEFGILIFKGAAVPSSRKSTSSTIPLI